MNMANLKKPTPKVPAQAFMQALRSLTGKWYLWAAKGPEYFDCSGAITYALKLAGGPDLTVYHNAAALYGECTYENEWQPGLLAFYGPPARPNHVMALDIQGKDFFALGACGGGSSTINTDIARRQSAKVQARKTVDYRSDLIIVGKWSRLEY